MYNRRIEQTLEAFQPFYSSSLTSVDGMEIQNNLNEFVLLLDRWSERRIKGLN